jgi:hypothetical protein
MSRAQWDKALAAYLARVPSKNDADPRAVTVARMEPGRTYVVVPLIQFLRERA